VSKDRVVDAGISLGEMKSIFIMSSERSVFGGEGSFQKQEEIGSKCAKQLIALEFLAVVGQQWALSPIMNRMFSSSSWQNRGEGREKWEDSELEENDCEFWFLFELS